MTHHAYVVGGGAEEGIARALAFIEQELGLAPDGNPDVVVRRYGLFSVEDARDLGYLARLASARGGAKAIIVSATRLFHEAQNALLKLFEEPPEDTYLFLVVPSEGMLLPTMRSRVMVLESTKSEARNPKQKGSTKEEKGIAEEFLAADGAARGKLVAKLLDRAKSDKDEEKQKARADALALAEGLARAAHAKWVEQQESRKAGEKESKTEADLRAFLADLDAFIPVLHERSAPLKPVFEHLLIILPRGL
jgi:DNA polymerase III delta prime subunit